MTHEQYLAEPASVVDWTMQLDDLKAEVQATWQD